MQKGESLGKVTGLDHLVLTVVSIEQTVAFYEKVLGMQSVVFGAENRTALAFGSQKINLHEVGHEFEPKAALAKPGTADLCLLVDNLDAMIERLHQAGVLIEEGPVARTGARGTLRSVYIRDPDGNLIELSVYESK